MTHKTYSDNKNNNFENAIKIGVVGYSSKKFDVDLAKKFLNDTFNRIEEKYPNKQIVIVSGLTNLGISGLTYNIAKKRGYNTVGIACSKANEYECFPVDKKIIVGEYWGKESSTFIEYIDIAIMVRGGKQSLEEINQIKKRDKPVYEYNLSALD